MKWPVVRGVHTLLSNCLDQAVAERLILTNPAQGCKLPKLEKKEMQILPQEKIGMYLAEAERRGLLAAFYLELTTDLRRGELLALLWTDLDTEARTISVTKQVNRIRGELVVSLPKTQNSVRTLAIPQQAVDLLVEEHKKHPGKDTFTIKVKTESLILLANILTLCNLLDMDMLMGLRAPIVGTGNLLGWRVFRSEHTPIKSLLT